MKQKKEQDLELIRGELAVPMPGLGGTESQTGAGAEVPHGVSEPGIPFPTTPQRIKL